MADMVVGRADEVRLLDAFLADPAPEPRALLIEGEPGIGKTTLLQGLLSIASERGYPVLSCRPARSEMDLSYVGLVELLAGVDEAVVDALPAPQVRVLRMILRTQEPQGTFDRLSLGVAVVAALRAVAADGPVLVAVDDTQWLDHPTARTLAFALRRLAGTPVRVALVRSFSAPQRGLEPPRPGGVVDWPIELSRTMTPGRLDTIRLGPNDASELSRIVRRVLGWVPAWPLLVRIAELSGGNPLYALELTRAVGANPGTDLTDSLPDNLVELARTRIARLPRRVRDAVGLAAVPRNPTLDLLRRLDSTALDLRDSLVTAARAGIVTFDGERIRFTHPILAAVGYGSIQDARRRELHRAVAMLSDDLEERARHLAAAAPGPDPYVAATLDGAAEQAWRRGAPDTAADLLGLACRLTPPDDADAVGLRRVAYGRVLYSAGDAPGGVAELEALAGSLPSGPIRARALYHLMYVTRLSGWLGRAVEYGFAAVAEAGDDSSFQSEVYELLSRMSDNDVALKLDAARKALESLQRIPAPDPDVAFHGSAALVEAEFFAGLGVHLGRLEGLEPGGRPRFPPVRTALRGEDLIGRLLAYDGRIDEGLEILRGMYERAAVESRAILPAILGWMAEAQIIAGRFAAAAELTREAIERSVETGSTGGTPWEVGFRAVALAMLGSLDEAQADATRVLTMAEANPAISHDGWPARLALGVVAAAEGRFGDAVTHLRQLDRAKQQAGLREPRICAHAGDLIEALVAAGDVDGAAEVLQRLEAEAATSSGRWSQAVAARGSALILAARGQLDEALAAAEHSRSLFDGLAMPFERARTVFVLGQVHRRRREKGYARAALTEALATFEDLATPVWADRARAELARIPLRRAASSDVDSLTATEERIARMVADGLTNREIADRVFLSPKTVEVNLTRIYRKLGVRSRAALAGRFAGG
jgi:DNA-binding CsgD family transcriptional regulator/KaiC/GvpD/RAD55 family RecA-like ATPase